MGKKLKEIGEHGLFRYLRWAGPVAIDVFTAWRDRPKWEEVMTDIELVAAENEKLSRRISILVIVLTILFVWNVGITLFFVFGRHGV
ncbi:MAG: hypothetical protein K8S54_14260 [Spirochaetia bacterium]|nr:hypothetical protein [Spirochaetia bacterium]